MEFPIRISNRIIKPKTKTYEEWWNSSIDQQDNTKVTNGRVVKDFYNNVTTILNDCNYQIDNEKKLKNELVTIIYTLSNDTI